MRLSHELVVDGRFENGTLLPALREDQQRRWSAVQETPAVIDGLRIQIKEVAQAPGKSALDVWVRNGVAAMCNALGNALPGHVDRGQGEVDNFNAPPAGAQAVDELQV